MEANFDLTPPVDPVATFRTLWEQGRDDEAVRADFETRVREKWMTTGAKAGDLAVLKLVRPDDPDRISDLSLALGAARMARAELTATLTAQLESRVAPATNLSKEDRLAALSELLQAYANTENADGVARVWRLLEQIPRDLPLLFDIWSLPVDSARLAALLDDAIAWLRIDSNVDKLAESMRGAIWHRIAQRLGRLGDLTRIRAFCRDASDTPEQDDDPESSPRSRYFRAALTEAIANDHFDTALALLDDRPLTSDTVDTMIRLAQKFAETRDPRADDLLVRAGAFLLDVPDESHREYLTRELLGGLLTRANPLADSVLDQSLEEISTVTDGETRAHARLALLSCLTSHADGSRPDDPVHRARIEMVVSALEGDVTPDDDERRLFSGSVTRLARTLEPVASADFSERLLALCDETWALAARLAILWKRRPESRTETLASFLAALDRLPTDRERLEVFLKVDVDEFDEPARERLLDTLLALSRTFTRTKPATSGWYGFTDVAVHILWSCRRFDDVLELARRAHDELRPNLLYMLLDRVARPISGPYSLTRPAESGFVESARSWAGWADVLRLVDDEASRPETKMSGQGLIRVVSPTFTAPFAIALHHLKPGDPGIADALGVLFDIFPDSRAALIDAFLAETAPKNAAPRPAPLPFDLL